MEPGLPGATWAGRSGAHITQPNVKAQTQVLNHLLVKKIVEESTVQSSLYVSSINVMVTLTLVYTVKHAQSHSPPFPLPPTIG
jgi:hypothetical protein